VYGIRRISERFDGVCSTRNFMKPSCMVSQRVSDIEVQDSVIFADT